MLDEAKVLEQMIRDTEQISLDDEVGAEEEGREGGEAGESGEGGEKGGGAPLIEPGSAIAILEEFIARCGTLVCVHVRSCDGHVITNRLPNLMNRKFVDEFAVEFCMSMNFKGNRVRLARALFNVDKNRYHSNQYLFIHVFKCFFWGSIGIQLPFEKKI